MQVTWQNKVSYRWKLKIRMWKHNKIDNKKQLLQAKLRLDQFDYHDEKYNEDWIAVSYTLQGKYLTSYKL